MRARVAVLTCVIALALLSAGCTPDADPTPTATEASTDTDCPYLDEVYGGDVTVWRNQDGECVSVEAVFEFACAPGDEGWISLGGTDGSDPEVQQFVLVEEGLTPEALPAEAESLQVTSGVRELFTSGHDPSVLFVVTPNEVQRWEAGIGACG